MWVVFLGFSLLVAAVFPVGDVLITYRHTGIESFLGTAANTLLARPLISYAFAFILVGWFFRVARLKERIVKNHPGIGYLRLGVGITLVYLLLKILSVTYFYAYLMKMPGGMLIFYIPQLLLLIGAANVLVNMRALPD